MTPETKFNNNFKVYKLFLLSEPAAAKAEDVTPAPASEAAVVSSAGGGAPEDLVAWFNSTTQEYDALFLIYYRGLW